MQPKLGTLVNLAMSGTDFSNWLIAMKTTRVQAAKLLGVSTAVIARYRREGAPVVVGLACTALYHRLGPWSEG